MIDNNPITVSVNIGLHAVMPGMPGVQVYSVDNVLWAMEDVSVNNVFQVDILNAVVKESESEPTAVMILQFNNSMEDIIEYLYALSIELGQDCIAVIEHNIYENIYEKQGHLVGPNAAKWGPFDINKFLFSL